MALRRSIIEWKENARTSRVADASWHLERSAARRSLLHEIEREHRSFLVLSKRALTGDMSLGKRNAAENGVANKTSLRFSTSTNRLFLPYVLR